jgi:hypothetical protein
LQASEIKEYTSIETFVTQLNKVFEKITLLVNTEHLIGVGGPTSTVEGATSGGVGGGGGVGLNPEEQHELVKRADQEIKQSEEVLENMQMIARNLIDNMSQQQDNEQRRVELEKQVAAMTAKWAETRAYIDTLAASLEKSCSHRKATEELATLRDVHEGYQRYINNAEPLSSDDAQKLNLQLETNKVCIYLNQNLLKIKGIFYLRSKGILALLRKLLYTIFINRLGARIERITFQ